MVDPNMACLRFPKLIVPRPLAGSQPVTAENPYCCIWVGGGRREVEVEEEEINPYCFIWVGVFAWGGEVNPYCFDEKKRGGGGY